MISNKWAFIEEMRKLEDIVLTRYACLQFIDSIGAFMVSQNEVPSRRRFKERFFMLYSCLNILKPQSPSEIRRVMDAQSPQRRNINQIAGVLHG